MSQFHEIALEQWQANPFQAIGKDWMLVTAKHGNTANPMTASWGSFGLLWHKPMAFVYIRPSRLTHDLLMNEDTFSLAFLDESYREQYNTCGYKSGRDMDKVKACGFTIAYDGGTPYIEQAHTVVFCRKVYRQQLESACFTDKALEQRFYAGSPDNLHAIFAGEITRIITTR